MFGKITKQDLNNAVNEAYIRGYNEGCTRWKRGLSGKYDIDSLRPISCYSSIQNGERLDVVLVDVSQSKKCVETTNDPVNRPSHYTDGKIEVIDFIEDKKLGFCLGNAIKYIARAGKKDPTKEIEDLRKAKWYVERRIKELEECS